MNAERRLAVAGGRGFIGGEVMRRAAAAGWIVTLISHQDDVRDQHFESLIYCSGVAWGADERAADAWDAHVVAPQRLLANNHIDRVVYVSSTRVYDGAASTNEAAALTIGRVDIPDVYRVSKIAGEAVLLSMHENATVARLSNVYGPSFTSGLFLSDVLRQAGKMGRAHIRSALTSAKDYVSVGDVADTLLQLAALENAGTIFNVAAGRNIQHAEIAAILEREGIPVTTGDAAENIAMPIDVSRLRGLLDWSPRSLTDDLPALIAQFREHLRS